MLREILRWPNKALSAVCAPVTAFDRQLLKLVDDLCETMQAKDGWGLAAPQVGELVSVCVVGATEQVGIAATPLVLVNPVIVSSSGEQTGGEGCLSFPDVRIKDKVEPLVIKCRRALTVRVAAFGVDGTPFTVEASGTGAVVLQHEIDHLRGVTIARFIGNGKQRKLRDLYRVQETR